MDSLCEFLLKCYRHCSGAVAQPVFIAHRSSEVRLHQKCFAVLCEILTTLSDNSMNAPCPLTSLSYPRVLDSDCYSQVGNSKSATKSICYSSRLVSSESETKGNVSHTGIDTSSNYSNLRPDLKEAHIVQRWWLTSLLNVIRFESFGKAGKCLVDGGWLAVFLSSRLWQRIELLSSDGFSSRDITLCLNLIQKWISELVSNCALLEEYGWGRYLCLRDLTNFIYFRLRLEPYLSLTDHEKLSETIYEAMSLCYEDGVFYPERIHFLITPCHVSFNSSIECHLIKNCIIIPWTFPLECEFLCNMVDGDGDSETSLSGGLLLFSCSINIDQLSLIHQIMNLIDLCGIRFIVSQRTIHPAIRRLLGRYKVGVFERLGLTYCSLIRKLTGARLWHSLTALPFLSNAPENQSNFSLLNSCDKNDLVQAYGLGFVDGWAPFDVWSNSMMRVWRTDESIMQKSTYRVSISISTVFMCVSNEPMITHIQEKCCSALRATCHLIACNCFVVWGQGIFERLLANYLFHRWLFFSGDLSDSLTLRHVYYTVILEVIAVFIEYSDSFILRENSFLENFIDYKICNSLGSFSDIQLIEECTSFLKYDFSPINEVVYDEQVKNMSLLTQKIIHNAKFMKSTPSAPKISCENQSNHIDLDMDVWGSSNSKTRNLQEKQEKIPLDSLVHKADAIELALNLVKEGLLIDRIVDHSAPLT